MSGTYLTAEVLSDGHRDPFDRALEVFTDSVLQGSVIDRFRAIAHRFASRSAVQDKAVTPTYAKLAGLVEKIAAATIAATRAAMLGVLAASRVYIPRDIEFPIEPDQLIISLVRRDKTRVPVSVVAYAVLRPKIRGLLPRHLQAMLARRLPRQLIPAQTYLLDELPRLSNLKVDRVRLAEIDTTRPIEIRDRLDDPTINKVAEIYQTILKVVGADTDDNIKSLWGDSLQAMDIQAQLERHFGVAIPDELVESRPSIRQIARYLLVRSIQVATGASA